MCSVCGESKPLSEFYKKSASNPAPREKCKPCYNRLRLDAYYRTMADPEKAEKLRSQARIACAKSSPEQIAKRKEAKRRWQKANSKRLAARATERYRTDEEYRNHIRSLGDKYRRNRTPKQKAAKNAYARLYRFKNKERVDGFKKRWAKNNPEKVREIGRRSDKKPLRRKLKNARRRGANGSYTAKQWNALLKRFGNRCVCCKIHASETPEKSLTADHIVPVSLGGSNLIENIQPLCKVCNSRKGNRVCIDYRDGQPKPATDIQLSLGLTRKIKNRKNHYADALGDADGTTNPQK